MTVHTTAPERIVRNLGARAGHVTAQIDQFYCGYLATVRDVETAILTVPCAKTHGKDIGFHPGI